MPGPHNRVPGVVNTDADFWTDQAYSWKPPNSPLLSIGRVHRKIPEELAVVAAGCGIPYGSVHAYKNSWACYA